MVFDHHSCRIGIQIEQICDTAALPDPAEWIIHAPISLWPAGDASVVYVTIHHGKIPLRLALIGPPCCCHVRLVVNRLIVVQFDQISQISLPDGRLIHRQRIDCPGGCLGFYPLKDGYLLHGEDAIVMLDEQLNTRWSFSGADIFASVTGKDAFILDNEKILLWDFQDNYYELDLSGRLLRHIPAKDQQ